MKVLSIAISIASAIPSSGQLVSSSSKQKRLRSLSNEVDGDLPLNLVARQLVDSMSMSMAAAMDGSASSSKSGKSAKAMKPVTAAAPIPLAPYCSDPGTACSSGALLEGVGLSERNTYSDTIDGCPDGTEGIYLFDESVESIVVTAEDGGELQAGKMAKIEAVVHAWDTDCPENDPNLCWVLDYADFWYAETVNTQFQPSWQYLGFRQATGPGLQKFEMPFIPISSGIQAIRVSFGYDPPIAPCDTDHDAAGFDDHDDIVFTVAEGSGAVAVSPESITVDIEGRPAVTQHGSICESLNQNQCANAKPGCMFVDDACVPEKEV